MKKFLFTLIAFAVIAPAAMAESGANQSFVSSPLGANWEVTAGIGTQFYLGEEDWETSFLNWWSFPAININLSKWVTPVFGYGITLGGIKYKGLYGTGCTFAKAGDATDAQTGYLIAKGYYLNASLEANISLVNLFAGYRPDRKYNLVAEMGGGVIASLGATKNVAAATFNARLANQFKINDKLKANLTVGGALVSDDFDGESYATSVAGGTPNNDNIGMDGIFSVTAGVTYAFDFSKKGAAAAAVASAAGAGAWVSMADVDEANNANVAAEQAKANDSANEAAAAKAEAEAAKKAAEQAKAELEAAKADLEAAKAKTSLANVDIECFVNFVIGSWEISNREMVNVQNIATIINQVPEAKFVIAGYADKGTGSAKRNQLIAKNRAESVYKALTQKYGVNADQLTVETKGAVAPMFFNKAELSRAAIVTIVK